MRRALRPLRRGAPALCRVRAAVRGQRAALHAGVLGLTPTELARLGDEDGDGGG